MFNNQPLPELSQLQSAPNLELNDNVKWCGTAGKIVKIDKKRNELYVKFINHRIVSFDLEGRYADWHADPALSYCSQEELERQANEWYDNNRRPKL